VDRYQLLIEICLTVPVDRHRSEHQDVELGHDVPHLTAVHALEAVDFRKLANGLAGLPSA